MTGTVAGVRTHEVVAELRATSRVDLARAWTVLGDWAVAWVLGGAGDRRRASVAPSGHGTVVDLDGASTVTGRWSGVPADPTTEVFVVTALRDGEPVALALPAATVTVRPYTDAGMDTVPVVRIEAEAVPVSPADVLGAPAPVLLGVAGIVAGLAEELTEQVVALARTKVRSGTADVLLGDPVVADALQHAHVELHALSALLQDTIARAAGGDDAMSRVVARVLVDRAEELAARITAPVGSAALYLSSPLQRLLRELTAVARHAGGVPIADTLAALAPRT